MFQALFFKLFIAMMRRKFQVHPESKRKKTADIDKHVTEIKLATEHIEKVEGQSVGDDTLYSISDDAENSVSDLKSDQIDQILRPTTA